MGHFQIVSVQNLTLSRSFKEKYGISLFIKVEQELHKFLDKAVITTVNHNHTLAVLRSCDKQANIRSGTEPCHIAGLLFH